jgi:hypothetical protein
MARPEPDFIALRLKSEHYLAIGKITATWGSFQLILATIIHELVVGHAVSKSDDLISAIPFFGQDASAQLGLLRTLASARFNKTDARKFSKLLDNVKTFKTLRDRLAHSHLTAHPKGSGILSESIRPIGKLKHDRIPLSNEQLSRSIDQFLSAYKSMCDLLRQYGYLKYWRPLPDIQP